MNNRYLVVAVVLSLGLGLDEAVILQLGQGLLREGLAPERLRLALCTGGNAGDVHRWQCSKWQARWLWLFWNNRRRRAHHHHHKRHITGGTLGLLRAHQQHHTSQGSPNDTPVTRPPRHRKGTLFLILPQSATFTQHARKQHSTAQHSTAPPPAGRPWTGLQCARHCRGMLC
jgi:hypothetical protein